MLTTKVAVSDCITTRWRNDAGTTTELFIDSPSSSLEQFGWRLSVALVEQPGPFSSFVGYHRILSVLTGKGIELIRGTTSELLHPGQALSFDGAESMQSQLVSGPIEDLNIIFNPKLFDCSVEWHQGKTQPRQLETAFSTLLVFCLKGELTLVQQDSERYNLGVFEAIRLDSPDNSSDSRLQLSASEECHFCIIKLMEK